MKGTPQAATVDSVRRALSKRAQKMLLLPLCSSQTESRSTLPPEDLEASEADQTRIECFRPVLKYRPRILELDRAALNDFMRLKPKGIRRAHLASF